MTQLPEVVLGRGDYSAGGARSQPFLDLDGARRRRPMVFGEVLGDASRCGPLAASMFSGRASDPAEWAVMWREVGADGVCLRLDGLSAEGAAALVQEASDRTRLPVAISGDPGVLAHVSSEVCGTVLAVIGGDSSADVHAPASPVSSVGEAEALPPRANRMLLVSGRFPERAPYELVRDIRARGLAGDERLAAPIVFDATPAWDGGFPDARAASMAEAESALAAMLCGADALIVRGPGAADMARVYGEELADLRYHAALLRPLHLRRPPPGDAGGPRLRRRRPRLGAGEHAPRLREGRRHGPGPALARRGDGRGVRPRGGPRVRLP